MANQDRYFLKLSYSSRLLFLALFSAIRLSSSAQSYFNRVYQDPEINEASSNLVIHGDKLYSVGVKALSPSSTVLLLRRYDLSGNIEIEKTYDFGTSSFPVGFEGHFIEAEDGFLFVGPRAGNGGGIYSIDLNLDTLWTKTVEFIGPHEVSYLDGICAMNENYLIAGRVSDDLANSKIVAGEFSPYGDFIQVICEPQEGDITQLFQDMQFIDNSIYLGTQKWGNFVPESGQGWLGCKEESTEFESSFESGADEFYDTGIRFENYSENEILACQLITDSIRPFTPSVWFNNLHLFVTQKNSLDTADHTVGRNFSIGRLTDFTSANQKYIVSGYSHPGSSMFLSSWINGFNQELTELFYTESYFLECIQCDNLLYDIELDEYGNIFGLGQADLDTLGFNGQHTWLIAMDCHGRTQEPNLTLSYDTTRISNDTFLFEANDSIFDVLEWSISEENIEGDSIQYTFDSGIHEIMLTGTYCGKEISTLIELNVPVGIEENIRTQQSIYPNPVHEYLNLQLDLNKYQQKSYVIFSSDMKEERRGNLTKKQIEVANLSPGLYVFVIGSTRIPFIKAE